MATATRSLTLEEFRCRYADEKPHYEFWFGEAIQKSVPTIAHGVLQRLLCALLALAGYRSGSEIELRIDPEWQPKPDVIGWRAPIPEPYPTEPVEVVVEVLSPDDRMVLLFEKCRHYQRIGIGQTFVFDPDGRVAWEWSGETENLERISEMRLGNGRSMAVAEIWEQLEKALG